MKNLFLVPVLLVFAVLFFAACASAPAPEPPPPPPPAPVEQPEPAPPPPAPATAPAPAPAPAGDSYNRHRSGIILDGAVQHTVRWGDTLSRLARRYYQDGAMYPLILMVNDNVISNPDKILPNTRLTIPALQVNLADSRAKQSMRDSFQASARFEDQRRRTRTATLIRNRANSF